MNQWEKYFLNICDVVSSNSKCFSRKIGAILVRDKIVVATGYNGPPRGFSLCSERWKDVNDPLFDVILEEKSEPKHDSSCPRQFLGFNSGERLDLCPAVHAEVNCIASAARLGVPTNRTIMYMNTQIPCKNCMGVLINAGIRQVVVTSLKPYDELSITMVRQSGISVITFDGEHLIP